MGNRITSSPVMTPGAYYMSSSGMTSAQMDKMMSIHGFAEILKNLNVAILAITEGSKNGLLDVAKFIRRDMETTPPLIPIDTNNLRSSWTVIPMPKDAAGNHGLTMGFSAPYALWVHEMVDGNINWQRPESGPKFLQAAINRNYETILQIIADKSIL